ncbi:MAG: AarF/ABC1/UbiB kinase family protein [Deltaproteobacteria bacterium]|nr:AarF/ABC1/UbiB kinase family protein [Deltaproteobacteria bacterium]
MPIRKIGAIGKTYRHIDRYSAIIGVFLKYGFGDLVAKLNLSRYLEMGKSLIMKTDQHPPKSQSRAERVRLAFEELGPTFIKFGQIMSTRPDLIPAEFITELTRLQDTVPPFEPEAATAIILSELKRTPEEVFDLFQDTPFASASIAQVHRAVLPEGEEVAVKIQRPEIKKLIETDLEIMLHLASLAERYIEGWEAIHPVGMVKEFSRAIIKELDFTLEAVNIDRMAFYFQDDFTCYVPKVYRELSTDKILVMELVHGVKVSELPPDEEEGYDRREIAARGADLIMRQIFEHGLFHGDPHPGNIFILEGNVVCFIDYGQMGSLGQDFRENFGEMMVAVVEQDSPKTARCLLKLTEKEYVADFAALERDVRDIIGRYFHPPVTQKIIGPVFNRLIHLLIDHGLTLKADFHLLIKAIVTIEGVARQLCPDFDMMSRLRPFAAHLVAQRMSPARITADLADTSLDLMRLLAELPSQARDIIAQLRSGRMSITYNHQGLEPLMETHDRMSTRVSFAIVLAAIIISSSLIILAELPPLVHGIPVIGLIGFSVAGVIGFWLLISIMRRGKL